MSGQAPPDRLGARERRVSPQLFNTLCVEIGFKNEVVGKVGVTQLGGDELPGLSSITERSGWALDLATP
jgi:hypothetical protein